MALYFTMNKKEYTVADWEERIERRSKRSQIVPKKLKVVFREHYPEHNPDKRAYARAGMISRKQMREKVLNHNLNRWV